MKGSADLDVILARLALAASLDEEAEIGRRELATLLHRSSPELFDDILTKAKRDNRFRRCLSAARYYSGLSDQKCARIDAVLQVPFPAAGPKRK